MGGVFVLGVFVCLLFFWGDGLFLFYGKEQRVAGYSVPESVQASEVLLPIRPIPDQLPPRSIQHRSRARDAQMSEAIIRRRPRSAARSCR